MSRQVNAAICFCVFWLGYVTLYCKTLLGCKYQEKQLIHKFLINQDSRQYILVAVYTYVLLLVRPRLMQKIFCGMSAFSFLFLLFCGHKEDFLHRHNWKNNQARSQRAYFLEMRIFTNQGLKSYQWVSWGGITVHKLRAPSETVKCFGEGRL